ncbi:MAG: CHAT domain-containing protein [Nostoc sp. TH1S01]|nr:CHAT domain-containing protein [Nostoc sp. TH1S01]
MQRRQILKAIPLFLATWASSAYAQNLNNDAIRLFDVAAAKHKRELEMLWKLRSAPRIHISKASSASIANILSVQDKSDDEATYPNKTSVLFYSYNVGKLHVWLLDEYGIQAYHNQSISKQQISEAISSLRNSLNINFFQRSLTPRQKTDVQNPTVKTQVRKSQKLAINELTQILLPTPIANKLDIVEHLIVVPILDIGTVPYAILKPFKNDYFLIDRMSISIAPSLFDVGQALVKTSIASLSLSPLIVGNPFLPESDDWSVPLLPGAAQEAKSVAKLMNAVPLLGKKATKTEILSKVEKSSFLYFATHGVANSHNPLLGGFLMLSAKKLQEGWWTAQEIQNTHLKAEMAVLSACQTGLGQTHDAGIIGLSRAFQIAGVPRVVMSLWSVDDQATSALMQAFMKHLETQFPSEALRRAMLEIRQDYSKPLEWASFVMFGTPR